MRIKKRIKRPRTAFVRGRRQGCTLFRGAMLHQLRGNRQSGASRHNGQPKGKQIVRGKPEARDPGPKKEDGMYEGKGSKNEAGNQGVFFRLSGHGHTQEEAKQNAQDEEHSDPRGFQPQLVERPSAPYFAFCQKLGGKRVDT